ncbi:unnamed protein product [marine sediment metagenome]|uniref:Uncharacterized protein n=1 Tax=marine sediment metagenome TaxID=412755 RepID=X1FME7_9ZZZZ
MVEKTDEEMAGIVSTLDLPLQATATYEKWQKALEEELGMRYSPLFGERTWAGIEVLYEKMPEAGIGYSRVEQKWGYQEVYKSTSYALTGVKAGQFMSFDKVKELLKGG